MVELRDVRFAYEKKPVLEGLTLSLRSPGAYAIWGPSGRGKTTLLHLIAGLLRPTGGEVRIEGRPRVAVCFQEDRLMPWLTVLENVSLTAPGRKREERQERGRSCLRELGLLEAADAYPAELSGGMKRRAALARALAFEGDMLLLDEPYRALDEAMHEQARACVRRHAQGRLLVLVTHDPADALGMERIVL